jgi:hypothetical protein
MSNSIYRNTLGWDGPFDPNVGQRDATRFGWLAPSESPSPKLSPALISTTSDEDEPSLICYKPDPCSAC